MLHARVEGWEPSASTRHAVSAEFSARTPHVATDLQANFLRGVLERQLPRDVGAARVLFLFRAVSDVALHGGPRQLLSPDHSYRRSLSHDGWVHAARGP